MTYSRLHSHTVTNLSLKPRSPTRVLSLPHLFFPSGEAAWASPQLGSVSLSLLPDLTLTQSAPQSPLYPLLQPHHSTHCLQYMLYSFPSLGLSSCCLSLQEYTLLLSTQSTPTQSSSSMPVSPPPGSLPGLLPLPDSLSADSRSDRPNHFFRMLPSSLPVLLRACSGLGAILISSGLSSQ